MPVRVGSSEGLGVIPQSEPTTYSKKDECTNWNDYANILGRSGELLNSACGQKGNVRGLDLIGFRHRMQRDVHVTQEHERQPQPLVSRCRWFEAKDYGSDHRQHPGCRDCLEDVVHGGADGLESSDQ